MKDRRRLARPLLPIQQGVVFLHHAVQVVLLQRGKATNLMLLVDECRTVEILCKRGVGCHILERLLLPLIQPSFAGDQTPGCPNLSGVGIRNSRRHRLLDLSRHQIDDAR